MDGGTGFGPHVAWARLVLVAVLVPLVVTGPVPRADALVTPAVGVAVTTPDPGVVGPVSGPAVGRPLSSPSRGGEDRRSALVPAGARPTADAAHASALDRELLARFD